VEGALAVTAASTIAVFTIELGGSYINKHVDELLSGRTVVVARSSHVTPPNKWSGSAPVFYVDRLRQSFAARLMRRAAMDDEHLVGYALAGFLRRHGVAAVLGEFLDQFLDFVPVLRRLGIPYVVQGHGIDVSAALRDPRMAERYKTYESARAILTRSEFHRRRLIELGLPDSKIHVNYGGVDIPAERPQRGPEAAKRFLAISYMVPKKGPIYVLEAFRRASLQDPEVTLDFIGGGPLFPAATQFVDAFELGDRVRLHGLAPEATKQRLLAECGVFIQHSLTDPETGNEEGLPAAIQEAMAHGLAVVSTRHAGIPEAVTDGVNGFLVEERDTAGMARALMDVTARAGEMGDVGYQRAAQEFSWSGERSRLLKWLGEFG
jgi:glycosyltransferase involved in cell wall biosynthesis